MWRSYSSKSFGAKRQGRPWKWMFIFLIIGFILGIIADQSAGARKPIELIISTPPPAPIIEQDVGASVQDGAWSDEQDGWVSTPAPELSP